MLAALLWSGLSLPGAARAQTQPLPALQYQAPAGCPDEAAFIMLVQARTGAQFPDAKRPTTVEVARGEARLRGTMRLLSRDGEVLGERTLEVGPQECDALVEALALTAASLLTSEASDASSERDDPATPPPLPPPTPPPWPEEPPTLSANDIEDDTSAPVRWSLALGPWLSLGRAPGGTVGGTLGVAAQGKLFSLGLTLMAGLQPEVTILDSGDRAQATLLLGSLSACYIRDPLRLCAALDLGVLSASVPNVEADSERLSTMMTLGLRPQLHFALGENFFIRPWLGVQASIVRPTIHVAGSQVWAMPIVSAGLGAEIGYLIE